MDKHVAVPWVGGADSLPAGAPPDSPVACVDLSGSFLLSPPDIWPHTWLHVLENFLTLFFAAWGPLLP